MDVNLLSKRTKSVGMGAKPVDRLGPIGGPFPLTNPPSHITYSSLHSSNSFDFLWCLRERGPLRHLVSPSFLPSYYFMLVWSSAKADGPPPVSPTCPPGPNYPETDLGKRGVELLHNLQIWLIPVRITVKFVFWNARNGLRSSGAIQEDPSSSGDPLPLSTSTVCS